MDATDVLPVNDLSSGERDLTGSNNDRIEWLGDIRINVVYDARRDDPKRNYLTSKIVVGAVVVGASALAAGYYFFIR